MPENRLPRPLPPAIPSDFWITNSLFVAYIGVPAFVVTLAGYQIWQGVIQRGIADQGVIVIQDNTVNDVANKFFTAVDEASKFCPVLFGAVRYLVELWFIGLAKVCGVGVRNGALGSHPGNGYRSVEPAREGDADAFADR